MPVMSDEGEYVTVESAGHLTGVPARTIRRWAAGGKVAVTAGQRGRLVRLEDVWRIAVMSGRPTGHPDMADESAGHAAGRVAVAPAAVAQLAAIRDEWLRPLVDQLNAKSEEIGHLKAERDELLRRVAELEAEQNAPGAAEVSDATEEPRSGLRAWWRRWWGGS
jgi:hypothetical protein